MSVELEWELYDIFDSGTFAFPIYDHSSARKIVRYLLMRGILHEEIAEAIEDSTGDLMTWLNRNGKHKVGEWVIAWVNDCRADFDRGELHKMGEEVGADDVDDDGEFDADFFLRDDSPDGDADDDDGGGEGRRRRDEEKRSDSRITELESISSQAATSRGSAETLLDRGKAPSGGNQLHQTSYEYPNSKQQRDIYELGKLSPPSSPRRARKLTPKSGRPDDLDLTGCNSSTDTLYDAPDSGHFSDMYTTIPTDSFSDGMTTCSNNNNNNNIGNNNNSVISSSCTAKLLDSIDDCKMHGPNSDVNDDDQGRDSVLAAKCTCSVAHYSYAEKPKAGHHRNHFASPRNLPQLDVDADERFYDVYFGDTLTCATMMRLDLANLDRDGPGFVFIMTDSIADCLPWSSEHRYRISSSRQSDRCPVDIRRAARRVDVDLIWQVKVKQHIKAVREIHSHLTDYNLHSNWFKCSLSLIMDTVSRVVKRYK
ncbi:hypothetical protein LSH36_399g02025 [Paralvinella palmiformis]|uniref:Uncharacterized protein n=1 Tax=Paralvinella palmiformis TaxID=53620 RepID=A0AAD9N0J3_9ANNE|nr:hypothetical protein LSH36_399g02025 [Paralvinella palmiformis]